MGLLDWVGQQQLDDPQVINAGATQRTISAWHDFLALFSAFYWLMMYRPVEMLAQSAFPCPHEP